MTKNDQKNWNWTKIMKMSKMEKIAKMAKLKWGRLGRYKNRQDARKTVLNSWDRALSMGHVEWSVRVQEKCEKGQCVFGLRTTILAPCYLQSYFGCFECSNLNGSEKLKFCSRKWILVKIFVVIEKCFFMDIDHFSFLLQNLCFTIFSIVLNFGSFLIFVVSFFVTFSFFSVKNPPPN